MTKSKSLNVLVVDDEQSIRTSIARFLKKIGHSVFVAENGKAALAAARAHDLDMVLLDIRMPDTNGLQLFQDLMEICPHLCVIMISGHGTMDTAIEAMRLGATDFLKKPIELLELEAAIERSTRLFHHQREEQRLRNTIQVLEQQRHDPNVTSGTLIGESDVTKAVQRQIQLAAETKCRSLLIIGPTGSGKEVSARAFHTLRFSEAAPFIAVNCPALPDTLVESELFGHVKGAFTGATDDRMGAFELADGGTLFLDEIGDLSLEAQAKLLRVLETRIVRRIGSNRERHVNVCVLAATNKELEEYVADGAFREDLLYRLNMFEIHLPPLSERKDDILPLADYFIAWYCLTEDRPVCRLSANAKAQLLAYDYPGNIRELRNIVERAVMVSQDIAITPETLGLSSRIQRQSSHTKLPRVTQAPLTSQAQKADKEAAETVQALHDSGWNRKQAAQALSISYETIRWRIKKYNLRPETHS